MYRSLKKHCPNFHLYIFPFDEVAFEILEKLKLESVTLISLKEFENPALLSIKNSRTKGEYCWTCTSSTIDYCLTNFKISHCTYIDADLCFYNNPDILLNELGDRSVLITEHRYTPKYDQSLLSGIYCVQFITFRNDDEGRLALHWWRDRCIEWCFARFEEGKFGDQKYLDDWPSRFQKVHVLQHLGGGAAPWNIQQYRLERNKSEWLLKENKSGKEYPLIFYHFHYVKFFDDQTINLANIYDLGVANVLDLYRDYIGQIYKVDQDIKQKYNFAPRTIPKPKRLALYKIAKNFYNQYQQVFGLYKNLNAKKFITSKGQKFFLN